jgi:hypothetical protein
MITTYNRFDLDTPGLVCAFDNFHLTFNFKSKVSRDDFKRNIMIVD